MVEIQQTKIVILRIHPPNARPFVKLQINVIILLIISKQINVGCLLGDLRYHHQKMDIFQGRNIVKRSTPSSKVDLRFKGTNLGWNSILHFLLKFLKVLIYHSYRHMLGKTVNKYVRQTKTVHLLIIVLQKKQMNLRYSIVLWKVIRFQKHF